MKNCLRLIQEGEVKKMKKTLLLSLILTGAFAMFPIANANAAVNSTSAASTATGRIEPQKWQKQRRWNTRTYTQTTTVRRGRHVYRETYRVTVRNGHVTRKLISRTQIR
jgi:hypothetical protein